MENKPLNEVICIKEHIFSFKSSKMIFEVNEGERFFYEKGVNDICLIRGDLNYAIWYPIPIRQFNQVFMTLSEWRDKKISGIIN